MFCTSCGQQIADTSKFCPYCGKVMQPAAPQPAPEAAPGAAPAAPAAPVHPPVAPATPVYNPTPATPIPPKPKKKSNFLPIALVAIAAIAVIAVVIMLFSGVFASDEAKVKKAVEKSVAAFSEASPFQTSEAFNEMVKSMEYNVKTELALSEINADAFDMPSEASMINGIGIGFEGACSIERKDLTGRVNVQYNSIDLISMDLALQDSLLAVRMPEMLGSDFYGINTNTLGHDLSNLMGYYEEDMENFGFNMFEIMEIVLKYSAVDEDVSEDLQKAFEELKDSIEVEKDETETLDINGKDIKCTGYKVTISDDAMYDFLAAYLKCIPSVDVAAMMEEMVSAMGLPDDMVEDLMYEMDLDSLESIDVDDLLDDMKDALKEFGDLELTVWIHGGYVHAVTYDVKIDGEKLELGLYIGGDGEYVDNLSLEMKAAGQKIALSSSGNHTGKGGTYDDTTTLKAMGQKILTSKMTYTPKSEDDNFEWSIDVNAGEEVSLDVVGQIYMTDDLMSVDLDELSITAMGEKLLELKVLYEISSFSPVVNVKNPVMVLELSQDELMVLAEEVEENVMNWAMKLAVEYPDLFEDMMYY